ncbi:MAG: peptidoglycan DD-metalloendopeptidase family protein [Lachnospiraceae bacterium]|nr:peptidoglycan DD-metalloendopeptidase family protein [Lachnospiraceae bacterium]
MRRKLFFNKKSKLVYIEAFVIACACMLLMVPFLGANIEGGSGYYEVTLAGKLVGSVKDPGVVEQAFLDARARISRETDGLVLADVEYSMEEVGKIFGTTMDSEALTEAIYEELQKDVVTAKKKAYLIKINEFTVTVGSYQDVLDVLNATRSKFDPEDEFEISIVSEADRELQVYTAEMTSKKALEVQEEEIIREKPGLASAFSKAGIAAYNLSPLVKDIITATVTEELLEEEAAAEEEEPQVQGDGLRELWFSEKVEIVESYVSQDQITPVEEAIELVTKDTEKNQIYEVQAGDTLSGIANGNGMLVKDLLALNEGMTENTVIRVGDELIITVPEPELSVITVEESTYQENYFAETQYILNDEWYTTKSVVRQEGQAGLHEVTALITSKNGIETDREIIAETVLEEPVAEIIEKGTQTPPTYIKPLSGGTFTSGFKWRWGRQHKGVDWACPTGTAIMASCGGKVIQAGWFSSYGNCVTIQHPDGRKTRYAHLSKVLVSVGESVAQGEKIALSGNTGRSTGPHLHFEIIINGSQVDPLKYLN